ncbi:MAG: YcjF family protein [Burkholderiaceae bacterium]
MDQAQQKAILTIAMLAAFADGAKADAEREQIRNIAQSLAGEAPGLDLAKLYQDALLKRLSLSDAAAALPEHDHKLLAYEMAVCVVDADGVQSAEEKTFLSELKAALGLSDSEAAASTKEADAIAELIDVPASAAPTVTKTQINPAVAAAAGAVAGGALVAMSSSESKEPVVAVQPSVSEAQIDASIKNYSILNGALELLPQSWASMAIIPLQMKMVYQIGKQYGFELDKGHVKEFIATAGVGFGSQYLEQFGRKLIGGLLGKVGGRMIGGLGSTATGMAFSFASTYALGQLAKRYYAGGRQMNSAVLQSTFSELLGPAKQMQAKYLPEIQAKAKTLDAGKIMSMVRGTP